jgi:hypothetical protein
MSFNCQREQKNKLWQALRQFAGAEISDELEGQNIDALENIIILEKNAYAAVGPGAGASGGYVEFVSFVPEYLSISQKLLGVHAAIAEVFHSTGAGDNILAEWGRIVYLEEDGADAKLLTDRLSLIVAS